MIDTKGETWTWGAEFEFSDWDNEIALPTGFGRSPDYTIVNSNSIAAQPNPKDYRYGGEINTPPTKTYWGQVRCLEKILETYHNVRINYRSNLHLHVRIPGLKDDLRSLKVIQEYIHLELPKALPIIEPIPVGNTPAEKKRQRRRKVSHQTFLTPLRLAHQLKAKTVKEFFEREVVESSKGALMWHAQPRLAVGLRQLLQTDTIEFRHFPGTLDGYELAESLSWCHRFLQAAFTSQSIQAVIEGTDLAWIPKFLPFDYDLEEGYQATAAHNGLTKKEIQENIALIEKGKFNGSEAQKRAAALACGVSRKHLS
jgi:hypothetical protein